ncbi:E3 ubiquitin-protein ligase RNF168 [Rhinophrynus dorsalis]
MPKLDAPLPLSECLCPICMEILLEPVTLPCDHTLCNPCFQMTVEKACICCPFCRKRVSTWARRCARTQTLINKELWERIQSQYPEECRRRASGQDIEDIAEGMEIYPAPHICKPGEIRQEYEAEISKIEAERLAKEEAERKASEEYIQKLLAEEEEEQQRRAEALQRNMEEQLRRDEELARILSSDLNESSSSSAPVSPVVSPAVPKHISTSKSCRGAKSKSNQSGDIKRFLSPNCKSTVAAVRSDPDSMEISLSMESGVCPLDEDEDEMPTLSPQPPFTGLGSPVQKSDFEQYMPCLSDSSSLETDTDSQHRSESKRVKVHNCTYPSSVGRCGAGIRGRNRRVASHTTTANFSPPRPSCSQKSVAGRDAIMTVMPAQLCKKGTLKRKCDGFSLDLDDLENYVNEENPSLHSPENCSDNSFHTVKLMELEETLYERKIQEEQDRLLALQLQRELDKEMKLVSRVKGSPDEYQLRPKRGNAQQQCLESPSLLHNGPKNSRSAHTKAGKHQDEGDSPDENKKPTIKNRVNSKHDRHGRAGTTADMSFSLDGLNVLKPINKQQTILEMFQRSSGK